jgi:hypothetical protein
VDATARLLAVLPDEARFVDLRGLLGRRDARAWAAPDMSWGLVRTEALHLVSVHGRPPAAALHIALAGRPPPPDLFVLAEHLAHVQTLVPGWRVRPGALHVLPAGARPCVARAHPTRLLGATDAAALGHLEAPLREELDAALAAGPVAAALDGDVPVAFCYAHHRTGRWWDVSIDTVASHRRRGFAAAASAALIAHLRREGLEPVWGALEENPASGRTARALGFVCAAPFAVVSPP